MLTHGESVWQEQLTGALNRSYQPIPQPFAPPVSSGTVSDSKQKTGISSVVVDSSGTLIATRDEQAPTTVWIWDLPLQRVKTVLIQHSPVKRLSWHPSISGLLLVSVEKENIPYIHIWDARESEPTVTQIPFRFSGGRFDVQWVESGPASPLVVVRDEHRTMLVWPQGKNNLQPGSNGDNDADCSTDSVFEALRDEIHDGDMSEMNDTFVGQKQRNLLA